MSILTLSFEGRYGWRLARCNLKIAVTDVMEPVHSQVLLTPSAYNSQVLFTLES
jgi:predicted oxidoreductase (fatty acid repression mutant protein)